MPKEEGGGDGREISGTERGGTAGRTARTTARHATGLGVRTLDEVQSGGVRLWGARRGAPRSLLQCDLGRRWTNPIAPGQCRASSRGAATNRSRSRVSQSNRGVSQGQRALGRCPAGGDPESGGLDRGGQKGGLKEKLATEIREEIGQLIGNKAAAALDFEAIETAARREALRLAAAAIECHLNADHSDYTGSRRPCPCGQSARFAGRRTKTFSSVLGPLQL